MKSSCYGCRDTYYNCSLSKEFEDMCPCGVCLVKGICREPCKLFSETFNGATFRNNHKKEKV